jgi:hypothetical protein
MITKAVPDVNGKPLEALFTERPLDSSGPVKYNHRTMNGTIA